MKYCFYRMKGVNIMFKKFNNNLNRSPVGAIWGISFVIILMILTTLFLPGETVIPKNQLVFILAFVGLFFNFAISSVILASVEIKQVNVTYVCPTARKYMSEQEIEEIENV